MKKGRLIVISGPSGAGKGTICEELFKDENVVFSVSMTTRAPRKGEVDGREYFFVSEEKFVENIENGGFLEHAQTFGNYYGTPKEAVLRQMADGYDVILDIDTKGARQVRAIYPESVLIFVLPPSMDELRRRIRGRGSENEEDIRIRLGEAAHEMSLAENYDYCIINDDINEAVSAVKAIIKAEHHRYDEEINALIEGYKEEK